MIRVPAVVAEAPRIDDPGAFSSAPLIDAETLAAMLQPGSEWLDSSREVAPDSHFVVVQIVGERTARLIRRA